VFGVTHHVDGASSDQAQLACEPSEHVPGLVILSDVVEEFVRGDFAVVLDGCRARGVLVFILVLVAGCDAGQKAVDGRCAQLALAMGFVGRDRGRSRTSHRGHGRVGCRMMLGRWRTMVLKRGRGRPLGRRGSSTLGRRRGLGLRNLSRKLGRGKFDNLHITHGSSGEFSRKLGMNRCLDAPG
jgi:hypothetical protein